MPSTHAAGNRLKCCACAYLLGKQGLFHSCLVTPSLTGANPIALFASSLLEPPVHAQVDRHFWEIVLAAVFKFAQSVISKIPSSRCLLSRATAVYILGEVVGSFDFFDRKPHWITEA